VTAAKLEVFGECGIDSPAGPSEVMVVADATADPAHVASDLLSQAEHGPDSPALLVTWDAAFAARVEVELAGQLETAVSALHSPAVACRGRARRTGARPDVGPRLRQCLCPRATSPLSSTRSKIAVARLRNAGSLFVGPYAPESAGDYASGANHVLPTGGLARSCGALSTESFGKFMQVSGSRATALPLSATLSRRSRKQKAHGP